MGRWKSQKEETSQAKAQRQGNHRQSGKSRTQSRDKSQQCNGEFQNMDGTGPCGPDSEVRITRQPTRVK